MRAARTLLLLGACRAPSPPVEASVPTPAPLPAVVVPAPTAEPRIESLAEPLGPPRSSIRAVLASREMSPDCKVATALAVGYLRGLGLQLELMFVADDASMDSPRPGQVTVRPGFGQDSSAPAVARAQLGADGTVSRASIVVAQCTPDVLLHYLATCTGMRSRLHSRDTVWGAQQH